LATRQLSRSPLGSGHNMKKIILVILFIYPCLALSQFNKPHFGRVQGKLVSCVDNTPIINEDVRLKWTNHLTNSDSLGKFVLDSIPFGQYHLLVIAFGYDQIDTLVLISDTIPNYLHFVLKTNCNELDANADIVHGHPKLLLVGSIAPICNSKQDSLFEKIYGLSYWDFGCQPPADACIKTYNSRIFSYLDKKYGDAWRKEVRKDVCFLK
jgi:hypothetical protein